MNSKEKLEAGLKHKIGDEASGKSVLPPTENTKIEQIKIGSGNEVSYETKDNEYKPDISTALAKLKQERAVNTFLSELGHNVGDVPYYISFGDGWERPTVKEDSPNKITAIKIGKNGSIIYETADNEYDGNEFIQGKNGVFWTKEEAEKWISENVPETYAYQRGEDAFFNLDNKTVPIHSDEHCDLIIMEGKLWYSFKDENDITVIADGNGNGIVAPFNYARFDVEIYDSYEEAQKKLSDYER